MKKKYLGMAIMTLALLLMSSTLCFATEGNNTIQPRYQYIVVTQTDNLNVRSGPGYEYSVIGSFAKGSIVNVSFAQESGIEPWCYAGGYDATTGEYIYGYIHEDYIALTGTVG